MKFNKLILGLAAFPLLLVSCNHQFTFEDAKQWVAVHYKDAQSKNAVATLEWDYHATTGKKGLAFVKDVFDELKDLSFDQGLPKGIIEFPDGKGEIGKWIKTEDTYEIPALTVSAFDNHWGKPKEDGSYSEEFKVLDGALTASFKYDLPLTHITGGPTIKDTANIFTYDKNGNCTGYGFKIGRYYIDNDNIVKMKVTLKFTYEDGDL